MNVKQRTRTGGFTLIELIVVIAILGILAGVGTVAYTGYVQRTNKHADQQLVADVVRGIILESYASPSLGEDVGMVILTDNGASVQGDPAVASAMANTFGKNWQTTMSLRYKWGKHTQATQAMLNSLDSEGSNSELGGIVESGNYVSYAAKADELFDQVEKLANDASSKVLANFGSGTTASQLLATTAGIVSGTGTAAATMAGYWEDATRTMDSYYTYNSDDYKNGDINALIQKLAMNAGNCARTYAFAEYVEQNAPGLELMTSGGSVNAAKLLRSKGDAGTVDAVSGILYGGNSGSVDQWLYLITGVTANQNSAALNTLQALANDYTAKDVGDTGKSQAYIDGLGYYALMNVVNDVSNGSDGNDPIIDPNASSSDYFDQASSHVSLAGLICSGQASVEDLKAALSDVDESSDNNVVVTVYRRGDGQLQFLVDGTEAGAYVQETINSTITGVDVTGALGIMFEKTTLTLDKGDTASVGFIVTGKTDGITYEVGSSDSGVATATRNGNTVSITGVGGGTATITLTATNSAGETNETTLSVTVEQAADEISLTITVGANHTKSSGFLWLSPTSNPTASSASPLTAAPNGTIIFSLDSKIGNSSGDRSVSSVELSGNTLTATLDDGTVYTGTIAISGENCTINGNNVSLPSSGTASITVTVSGGEGIAQKTKTFYISIQN